MERFYVKFEIEIPPNTPYRDVHRFIKHKLGLSDIETTNKMLGKEWSYLKPKNVYSGNEKFADEYIQERFDMLKNEIEDLEEYLYKIKDY